MLYHLFSSGSPGRLHVPTFVPRFDSCFKMARINAVRTPVAFDAAVAYSRASSKEIPCASRNLNNALLIWFAFALLAASSCSCFCSIDFEEARRFFCSACCTATCFFSTSIFALISCSRCFFSSNFFFSSSVSPRNSLIWSNKSSMVTWIFATLSTVTKKSERVSWVVTTSNNETSSILFFARTSSAKTSVLLSSLSLSCVTVWSFNLISEPISLITEFFASIFFCTLLIWVVNLFTSPRIWFDFAFCWFKIASCSRISCSVLSNSFFNSSSDWAKIVPTDKK